MGPISRNAYVFSESYSLSDGIWPAMILQKMQLASLLAAILSRARVGAKAKMVGDAEQLSRDGYVVWCEDGLQNQIQ